MHLHCYYLYADMLGCRERNGPTIRLPSRGHPTRPDADIVGPRPTYPYLARHPSLLGAQVRCPAVPAAAGSVVSVRGGESVPPDLPTLEGNHAESGCLRTRNTEGETARSGCSRARQQAANPAGSRITTPRKPPHRKPPIKDHNTPK